MNMENSMDTENNLNSLLEKKVEQTTDVKTAIDILATKTALKQEETLEKVVTEKQEELRNDAEAKRIQAETDRISKEVEKVKQEKEKELAELDKEISAKQKEVERLKADSDKSQAFFDSNKDILKYIGIREKKSMKTMQGLMFPATIVFVIVQILLFPLTFCGLLLETIVGIVGAICGKIASNGLKIGLSILIILLVCGVGFCAYYFGGKIIL
jgi:predicted RND superfamily exporter protein